MLKQIVGTLMLLVCTGASSAPVPRYATELEKFTSDWQRTEDALRLRVTVATESSQGERAVRVGDVTLCTAQAACFKARSSGYVDIGDTSLGTASTVADVVIPVTTITDVYFNDTGDGTAVAGHLKLQSPVILEKDFYGLELMIVLRKETVAGRTTYTPAQSGHGYFNDEAPVVRYVPSTQTTAKLPLGTVLTIPAGALDKPEVFSVNVHSTGNLYPTADIFPYVDLKKPATIVAPPIPGGVSMHVDISPIGLETEKEMWADMNSAALAKPGRVTMTRTGVVHSHTFEEAAEGIVKPAPGPTSDATTGKTCAEYLAQPIVLGLINLATITSGAARVYACEKIAPYVHIVYVNTLDKRIQFSIPFKGMNIAAKANGPYLSLNRINSFTSSPSLAFINGFTWAGQAGTTDGQAAKAEGIVRAGGVSLGDNIEGGGASCTGCATSGNKFVMAYGADKARPTFLTTTTPSALGSATTNVVSSSTSIVKDGTCASAGGQNRWSAVGASNGRMVLISSTTEGQTTAEELCAVFKALAIKNALRLDGGPSAGMIASGEVLSELQGMAFIKYGSLRHIAYPLRISY